MNALNVQAVYVIDVQLTSGVGTIYNQRLNTLFAYMLANSPGPYWSMAISEQGVADDFWGGDNLDIWQLSVS
jgi:hypothetical protein